MALKIGSTAVATFRVGSTTPAKVAKGATEVWSNISVPGAPNLYSGTYSVSLGYASILVFPPASDGGSAITSYKPYYNGVEDTIDYTFPGDAGGLPYFNFISFGSYEGATAQVSAVNAIGEGPKSNSLVLTTA